MLQELVRPGKTMVKTDGTILYERKGTFQTSNAWSRGQRVTARARADQSAVLKRHDVDRESRSANCKLPMTAAPPQKKRPTCRLTMTVTVSRQATVTKYQIPNTYLDCSSVLCRLYHHGIFASFRPDHRTAPVPRGRDRSLAPAHGRAAER